MFVMMIIVLFVFVGLTLHCGRSIALELIKKADDLLSDAERSYRRKVDRKGTIFDEKLNLENQTLEIFTLYEITKEITSSFSEENAKNILQQKLYQHVSYKDVKFLEPQSEEIRKFKRSKKYFVHLLRGKKRKMGYIVIRDLQESDKENFVILANQFALALRRIKLYQEIERIAIMDSLTQVHTRRYALDRFHEEFQRSKSKNIPMSFLMVDVDHFKKFNDTYGHLTGDQILREIASIVKDSIREIDIAGRFGGEEFCVVLPDTNCEGAQYAAERIRQAAEHKEIKAYDTSVKATVSIGITTYPNHGKSVEELIDKADWALYRAKQQGRNRICSFGNYKDNEKDK